MSEKDIGDIRGAWQKLYTVLGRYPRLAVIGGLGLVLMLSAPLFETDEPQAAVTEEVGKADTVQTEETAWEAKLERILSEIDGAGTVEVAVQIEEKRIEHEKNRTHEKRSITEGGAVTVEEKVTEELPMRRENGTETPVIARALRPSVKGVLVVAEGAASSEVRANIRSAVETATGVPAYRVKVLAKRRKEESR